MLGSDTYVHGQTPLEMRSIRTGYFSSLLIKYLALVSLTIALQHAPVVISTGVLYAGSATATYVMVAQFNCDFAAPAGSYYL